MQDNSRIEVSVPARVGLLGNPSDGFNGKTLSCTISNFAATVRLIPQADINNEEIVLVHNPDLDCTRFQNSSVMYKKLCKVGYDGGIRLLLPTCKKFFEFAQGKEWTLKKHGFQIEYETTIPRQVGLSGSSAIITALFKCLLTFYNIPKDAISLQEQANFVLKIETEELGIAAGLQDRVVQAYGGLVYMDFAKAHMERYGYGIYEKLDLDRFLFKLDELNVQLFIAYMDYGIESGKKHSTVKARWLAGDTDVHEAMKTFASFAEQGKEIIDFLLKADSSVSQEDELKKLHLFAHLMNENFNLRRKIYGDEAIGKKNLEMIEIARGYGASCKFSGSGGAIVGMLFHSDDFKEMQLELKTRDITCCHLSLSDPYK